jgi:uncharacterized protein (TIGR03435 family)
MRMTTIVAAVLIAALAVTSVPVRAQDITLSPKLSFEVSSSKIVNGDARSAMRWQPGGHFTMREPLLRLVSLAYRAPDFRIVGLPDWVRTVFVEINARANRQVTLDEQRALYRGLFEDRFRAAVHVEERELPVYALVLARTDGRLGPGLRRSDMNCDPIIAESIRRAEAGEPPVTPAPGSRPTCAMRGGAASIIGGAVPIATLAAVWSTGGLDRPVVDRTGLAGRFDVDFKSAVVSGPFAGTPTDLPSVFTAVQEQLGLKLEPSTVPMSVLVIDRLDLPTEN